MSFDRFSNLDGEEQLAQKIFYDFSSDRAFFAPRVCPFV